MIEKQSLWASVRLLAGNVLPAQSKELGEMHFAANLVPSTKHFLTTAALRWRLCQERMSVPKTSSDSHNSGPIPLTALAHVVPISQENRKHEKRDVSIFVHMCYCVIQCVGDLRTREGDAAQGTSREERQEPPVAAQTEEESQKRPTQMNQAVKRSREKFILSDLQNSVNVVLQ